MSKVWMEVTDDGLELPIAAADSATELARMRGVTPSTIMSSVCRNKQGKYWSRYQCVEIDDKEEEDGKDNRDNAS